MNSAMMMERTGMGMPGMGMGMPGMTGGAMTSPSMMPGTSNMMMVPRCTMKMEKCDGGMKITCTTRRQDGRRHDPEPLHDDGRRHVLLLHDDERHDGVLLQPHDGHVQVRDDRGRRVHHLHQRRQGLLRHDPGVLRLHVRHDEGRLHLLRDDEQHAGLLRLLNDRPDTHRPQRSTRPGPATSPSPGRVVICLKTGTTIRRSSSL